MPVPILTVQQTRQWEEATWAQGGDEASVIREVGRKVAARALALTQRGDRIIILAGKGHNGDDARAALAFLPERDVQLIDASDPSIAVQAVRNLAGRPAGLLLDGLFGIGLNRALSQPWIDLIGAVNDAGWPILAVDVPSGLNADSGEAQPAAIRATATLTVGSPKVGLIAPGAAQYAGTLSVAEEIGFIPCPFEVEINWTLPSDFAGFPPGRSVTDHKGTFGHAAIMAGSVGYHGAAVLAARSALRAHPGLVTVLTSEGSYLAVAAQAQAAMVRPFSGRDSLPERITALAVGPGLAQANLDDRFRKTAAELWTEAPYPIVADASGLEWLPVGPCRSAAIRVITPHPGEAARLLQTDSGSVQQARVKRARELSERYGNCHVVLKGHQTLVTAPGGKTYLNPSGNPWMAQGGSGDILAGYLAGLLAQERLQRDPLRALRYGVWQHGLAADFLTNSRRGWTVEELPDALEFADRSTLYPNSFSLAAAAGARTSSSAAIRPRQSD